MEIFHYTRPSLNISEIEYTPTCPSPSKKSDTSTHASPIHHSIRKNRLHPRPPKKVQPLITKKKTRSSKTRSPEFPFEIRHSRCIISSYAWLNTRALEWFASPGEPRQIERFCSSLSALIYECREREEIKFESEIRTHAWFRASFYHGWMLEAVEIFILRFEVQVGLREIFVIFLLTHSLF